MAKRHLGTNLRSPAHAPEDVTDTDSSGSDYEDEEPPTETGTTASTKPLAARQPSSLGRIHEIDLGAASALRNYERTEAALRQQQIGQPADPAPGSRPRKPRRARLGRDGKPLRPRPRKGRNSSDIERDALVEQVLKETRIEIYDGPSTTSHENANATANAQQDELEADDRVAEQFRRDFIDAMQSRKRHRTSGQPKPPGGGKREVLLSGPKLGGSRSARAAMRERALAKAKEKTGGGKKKK